jgi:hypothetical protein
MSTVSLNYCRLLIALIAGLFLNGCFSELGNSGNHGGLSTSQIILVPGQIVGKISLRAPTVELFTLRSTMPLPIQIYPITSGTYLGQEPFVIVDSDGSLVAAQTEVVSSFPKESDGADVVELIARVHKPSGVTSGDTITYKVMYSPHSNANPAANFTSARQALLSVSGLTNEVRDLLNNPDSLVIRARDLFSNNYQTRPLADNPRFEVTKIGSTLVEIRVYETLQPTGSQPLCSTTPQAGCMMKHLMGVNTYLTAVTGESALRMNLQFNNGPTNLNPQDNNDDPVGKLYFESIEAIFPKNWQLTQQGKDPFVGNQTSLSATQELLAIVRPINEVYPLHPNQPLHSMEIFAQFQRRLALSTNNTLAASLLNEEGQGVMTAGNENGFDYFSWQNPITARYFPQRMRLPSMNHISKATVDNIIVNAADPSTSWASPLNTLNHAITTGEAPGYPLEAPVMGWAHPSGESFGGGPGGTELAYFDGLETVLSGSNLGFVRLELRHRMLVDRSPIAMINADGRPTQYDNWVYQGSQGPNLRINVFGTASNSMDQFGYPVSPGTQNVIPNYQDQQVQTLCRYAYYDKLNPCNITNTDYNLSLPSYQPYDMEHANRGWRTALPLVWLANDTLAKHDVRMNGEIFQLTFTDLLINGGQTGVSMKARIQEVNATPNRGFWLGRFEGWGMQIFSAAYSISNHDWRSAKINWLNKIPDLVDRGQCKCASELYCHGIISRKPGIPFEWVVDGGAAWCNNINGVNQCGNVPGTQIFENDIIANGLWSLYSSVFENADPARAAQLKTVLVKVAKAITNAPTWATGNFGPYAHIVIGNLQGEPFCSATSSDIGFGQHGPSIYPYYDRNTLAIGYLFSDDLFFINRLETMVGGPLQSKMQNLGMSETGMSLALHSIAETL